MNLTTAGGDGPKEFKMMKFRSILQNTFIQSVRQPIFSILIVVTFAILVLSVPLTGWTLDIGADYRASDQKMLENLGLSTLLISGLLVAAFSASSVLAREIDDKTALTVISKPVSRGMFVLGKFAGVAAAVAVAYYLCSIAFLLTVRHGVMSRASDPYDFPVIVLGCSALVVIVATATAGNFFFGWTFTSAWVFAAVVVLSLVAGVVGFMGKEWTIVPFGHEISAQLLIGMSLMFMAVLVFVAVAVAASTRLGQIMTLLVCLAVFVVGWSYSFVFKRWADEMPAVGILGWIAPNLRYFDAQDPLTLEKAIPLGYVGIAAAYCACYVAGVLAIGAGLFQTRQLYGQESSSSMPAGANLLAWGGRAVALGLGIAALVILSLERFHTVWGVITGVVLLASAVGGWMVWGYFARGVRWSYWLVLVGGGGAGVLGAAVLLIPPVADAMDVGQGRTVTVWATLAAVVVLLVALLPKTRRHFKSA